MHAPVTGSQESVVHGFASSHVRRSCRQPYDPSQRSIVHGSPSSQRPSFGVPLHEDPLPVQRSFSVHAMPSSHWSPAVWEQSHVTTNASGETDGTATAAAKPPHVSVHSSQLPSKNEHVNPGSTWQLAEQPSPSSRLPSSHCSPGSTMQSPHVAS